MKRADTCLLESFCIWKTTRDAFSLAHCDVLQRNLQRGAIRRKIKQKSAHLSPTPTCRLLLLLPLLLRLSWHPKPSSVHVSEGDFFFFFFLADARRPNQNTCSNSKFFRPSGGAQETLKLPLQTHRHYGTGGEREWRATWGVGGSSFQVPGWRGVTHRKVWLKIGKIFNKQKKEVF